MYGVALTGHGGPEMLQWRDDLATPSPMKGDVIIEVNAAGVNYTDLNTRIGWYSKGDAASEDASWSGTALSFPLVQGADVCGTIVAVGEGVNPERIGERVLIEPCLREANGEALELPWYCGSECDGGFSQYTRVAARHAISINSDLTDVELASFPCSYSTAENMLTRARVIAVTSASKAPLLSELGAETTLTRDDDYLAKLGANSVDVVIDLVAGPKWPALLDILRPFGRYAVAGAIAGPIVDLDVRTLYLKDLSFFGCTILEPEVFDNLVKRIESKQIKPLVAETFTLADIEQAQASFSEKGHVGKIVLTVR
jgi:NADPH:quinone reductase-like Zn-dependent oxidoreductase